MKPAKTTTAAVAISSGACVPFFFFFGAVCRQCICSCQWHGCGKVKLRDALDVLDVLVSVNFARAQRDAPPAWRWPGLLRAQGQGEGEGEAALELLLAAALAVE